MLRVLVLSYFVMVIAVFDRWLACVHLHHVLCFLKNLFCFLPSQQARTMADKDRTEDVARTDGDKQQLVLLAKSWFVPFLSQVVLFCAYSTSTTDNSKQYQLRL